MPGYRPKSGGGHKSKLTGSMKKSPPISAVKPIPAAPKKWTGTMNKSSGDHTPFNPRARGSRLP